MRKDIECCGNCQFAEGGVGVLGARHELENDCLICGFKKANKEKEYEKVFTPEEIEECKVLFSTQAYYHCDAWTPVDNILLISEGLKNIHCDLKEILQALQNFNSKNK